MHNSYYSVGLTSKNDTKNNNNNNIYKISKTLYMNSPNNYKNRFKNINNWNIKTKSKLQMIHKNQTSNHSIAPPAEPNRDLENKNN